MFYLYKEINRRWTIKLTPAFRLLHISTCGAIAHKITTHSRIIIFCVMFVQATSWYWHWINKQLLYSGNQLVLWIESILLFVSLIKSRQLGTGTATAAEIWRHLSSPLEQTRHTARCARDMSLSLIRESFKVSRWKLFRMVIGARWGPTSMEGPWLPTCASHDGAYVRPSPVDQSIICISRFQIRHNPPPSLRPLTPYRGCWG